MVFVCGKHLDNLEVTHLLVLHIGSYSSKFCTDCVPLIDSDCFFFSMMQRAAVLVLVFMWCTQTVHAQQGQWTVLDKYILHIRAITTKIGRPDNGEKAYCIREERVDILWAAANWDSVSSQTSGTMTTILRGRDMGGRGGLGPPTFQIGGAQPPQFFY